MKYWHLVWLGLINCREVLLTLMRISKIMHFYKVTKMYVYITTCRIPPLKISEWQSNQTVGLNVLCKHSFRVLIYFVGCGRETRMHSQLIAYEIHYVLQKSGKSESVSDINVTTYSKWLCSPVPIFIIKNKHFNSPPLK